MKRTVSTWTIAAAAALAGVCLSGGIRLVAQSAQFSGRDQDVAAIRAHIERIFDAFIEKDAATLAVTHGRDWRGYLSGSRTVIKGRDGYVRAAGAAGPMGPKGQGMIGYKILEYDTVFYGDVAVVNFVADVEHMNGTTARMTKLTLMDIYAKEDGEWTQVASQTSLHPDYQDTVRSLFQPLTDAQKAPILAVRDAVWKAWYSGDTAALAELVPPELVTLTSGSTPFGDHESMMAGAKRFAASGRKLVRVTFPRTEFQTYGNTVILYTTYALELEKDGVVTTEGGRATEVFVRRGSKFLNTGWHLSPDR